MKGGERGRKLCVCMRNLTVLRKFQNHSISITECYNIYQRNHENFGYLRKTIEKSIRHQSDPNRNTINLTKHSFTKAEYKLLHKNLNFIPTTKAYN